MTTPAERLAALRTMTIDGVEYTVPTATEAAERCVAEFDRVMGDAFTAEEMGRTTIEDTILPASIEQAIDEHLAREWVEPEWLVAGEASEADYLRAHDRSVRTGLRSLSQEKEAALWAELNWRDA